jgi:hypothetical protein
MKRYHDYAPVRRRLRPETPPRADLRRSTALTHAFGLARGVWLVLCWPSQTLAWVMRILEALARAVFTWCMRLCLSLLMLVVLAAVLSALVRVLFHPWFVA